MTKIIRARNVKTVHNIEDKPWSQKSGPGDGLLILDLSPAFHVLGHGS